MPNKRYYHPSLASRLGYKISRGDILNGTVPTFFGPGQQPGDMADIDGYKPPTDWATEEFALRMPQVVWLSLCYYVTEIDQLACEQGSNNLLQWWWHTGSAGTELNENCLWAGVSFSKTDSWPFTANGTYSDDPWVRLTGSPGSPTGGQATTISFGAGGDPATDPWLFPQQFITNYDYNEYHRLLTIFQNIKAQIETIRKGKTWVNILDWTDTGSLQYGGKGNFYLYPWMSFPDPSTPFLGTNFFHIFCGRGQDQYGNVANSIDVVAPGMASPLRDIPYYTVGSLLDTSVSGSTFFGPQLNIMVSYNGGTVTPFQGYYPVGGGQGSPGADTSWGVNLLHNNPNVRYEYDILLDKFLDPSNNTAYFQSKTRFQQGWKYFFNYGCRVYSFTAPDQTYGYYPLLELVGMPDPIAMPLSNTIGIDGINTGNYMSIDLDNWRLHIRNQMHEEFWQMVCEDLSSYNYQYMGDSTTATESNLIAQIANYFNFNPNTGKDYP